MDSQEQHLLLAAMLHDIGKWMQRADVPLSDQTTARMSAEGPHREWGPSHLHVQWTEQFFHEHFPLSGVLSTESGVESAAQLAFRHHNPSTPLETILQRMERGEGTLGKLLKDDKLYSNMDRLMVNLDGLVVDLKENPKRYLNISIF